MNHKNNKKKLGRPLYTEELLTRLQPREPLKSPTGLELDLSFLLAADQSPDIDCGVEAVYGANDSRNYQVKLSVRGAALGKHVFPPPIEIRRFEAEHDIRKRQEEYPDFEGYLPDHLALHPLPARLEDRLRVARRIHTQKEIDRSRELHQATTIFAPDDRYLFNDTAFPWCTTGRVDTPGGQSSGVMIGPRHLLTVSHAIQWNSDNTAGWVKFTPSYFDGSMPFGIAWGIMVYWEGVKVVGPTINRNEGQHDYVCVVLDRRIGDLTGWMGSRSWSDDWDGEPYWYHIGYPGDLAGGQRPSFQSGIALDGSFWDREVHTRIFHQGDVWPGQSGGPFFAWWAGESWPRVVATQSGQNSDENSASGGAHMVDCVIRARSDFP